MILGYKVHQLKVPISEKGTRKEKDMEDIYVLKSEAIVRQCNWTTVYLFKDSLDPLAPILPTHKSPQHSVSFSMKC